MDHLLFVLYVLVTAFAFARLEIQIEGPAGWAENLPTWRISNRWTDLLYGCRPLTGYHFWVQIFLLLMVHLPFALGFCAWTWPLELRALAFLIFFYLTEDFLWFVINPAYGIRRFRPEHIWWHARTWWWVMPRDYWIFTLVGLAAYFMSLHSGQI
ncbi:MAG TPA: hypothetical protein VG722_08035 [Tepidisphaeraceae bacterium]|nr:hypothetical protein [Tepidisphaeraceae bacterium]